MGHHNIDNRRFQGEAERLRSAERVARLEVSRVVSSCCEELPVTTLLDIGTGTGLFAEAFSLTGLSVTGIDVNTELLAIARQIVPEVTFKETAAEQLPFENKSFDMVFLGLVLHELDDISRALAEVRRVARYRVAILEWPYRAEEHGPPIEHRLQDSMIRNYCEQAGFQHIHNVGFKNVDLYILDV